MKYLVSAVMTSLLIASLSVQAGEEVSVKQMVEHMMQQNAQQLNEQIQQENHQAIRKSLSSVRQGVNAGELLVRAGSYSSAKSNSRVNAK